MDSRRGRGSRHDFKKGLPSGYHVMIREKVGRREEKRREEKK